MSSGVFSVTWTRGIEEGFLIDVTDASQKFGFNLPIALSQAVWEACIACPFSQKKTEAKRERLRKLLCSLFFFGDDFRDGSERFTFHTRDLKTMLPVTVVLQSHLGSDDKDRTVNTIMLAENG